MLLYSVFFPECFCTLAVDIFNVSFRETKGPLPLLGAMAENRAFQTSIRHREDTLLTGGGVGGTENFALGRQLFF